MKDKKTNAAIESRNCEDARLLFEQAKADICADMKSRDIGAILWDNDRAGFHFPPAVKLQYPDSKTSVWTIQGIYRIEDSIFLMSDKTEVNVNKYYEPGIEEPPSVVTLTQSQALKQLGDPTEARGYTRQGSIQEWLTIADCYFEALALNNDI